MRRVSIVTKRGQEKMCVRERRLPGVGLRARAEDLSQFFGHHRAAMGNTRHAANQNELSVLSRQASEEFQG